MNMDDVSDYAKQFEDDVSRESENRARAADDIRFARLGEQWPEKVKKDREREGRPCLTINRMPTFIRQVVNDGRMNSPQIKVKPVDDNADPETAEIFSGLIRNIEYVSQADVAYDTALESAVTCGMGFFRICTDYTSDDEFAQDIFIKRITNPLSVVYDSHSESLDGSDWNHVFLIDWITKAEHKRRYGKKEAKSFSADVADGLEYTDDDMVRVAEAWEIIETPGTLLLLSDGTVLTKDEYLKPHPEIGVPLKEMLDGLGITVARERKTTNRKVRQRILGAEILDEQEWAGKYLPIVPVFGDEVWVDGKRHLKSLIHDARDAQMMLNFWRTASTELVALAPKAPYIGPQGAFKTDSKKWATANVKSWPYLEYDGGVIPQRQPFAGPPAGALQEALNASDDMKAIIGIYDASLGARSNETSGRAIMARQREGDVSTFHFIDNLAKSIAHGGRILVDLIPKIYDTERVVRVMGYDGQSENVKLKAQTEHKGVERIFDLGVGKYDVAVDTGPSFTTQREEAATQMMELLRNFPSAAPIVGDLLAKNLNWPGADEIAKRLKAMLPPQILAMEQNQLPPEAQARVAQLENQLKQMSQAMQQGMEQFKKVVAELESVKADKSIDTAKVQVDAYKAETERMAKVQAPLVDNLLGAVQNQLAPAQNMPMPAGM